MRDFFDRLAINAATIDELLSDDFESLVGQKKHADSAALKLSAWCRASASGDWALFARRLERDRTSINRVLARFSAARRRVSIPIPAWVADARWIDAAFQNQSPGAIANRMQGDAKPHAFEHILIPVVDQAEKRLWADIGEHAASNLTESARAQLRAALFERLSDLCAPAFYDRFVAARRASSPLEPPLENHDAPESSGDVRYWAFVANMREGGARQLFEEKPVLLRLIASLTRQWMDTTHELVIRLDKDLPEIRRILLRTTAERLIVSIEGGHSDAHNFGRSVHIVTFDNGQRVVYKPKDLQLDACWRGLIDRLNRANPPEHLTVAQVIARKDYGWMEFISHTGCNDQQCVDRFFRRAGAWLALFYVFASTDMHEENIIAASDIPVPIDLEMTLQASAPDQSSGAPEKSAVHIAAKKIADSVMMTGLLPAYGRSHENKVFELGGLNSERLTIAVEGWENINTDRMRPSRTELTDDRLMNIPRVDGKHARLGDHVDELVTGFKNYATFLLNQRDMISKASLFDGFAGLRVRKVLRPTRFYYLLMSRLKDQRSMESGVTWSAQVDFIARLADWDKDIDPIWPLQRAERAALIELNVPHFVSLTDRDEITDSTGIVVTTGAVPGLVRAQTRFLSLDEGSISWQSDIIRLSTSSVAKSAGAAHASTSTKDPLSSKTSASPSSSALLSEARSIASTLSDLAIRSGPGAAWLGLVWLEDSAVAQLAPLGSDLYNGAPGVSIFLAAVAKATDNQAAGLLALAGVSALRQNLKGANAARFARGIGIGGASGLGSVVYSLILLAQLLNNDELRFDALCAAQLFTDELIGADKALDVIGGSAGAILGLLRLHRVTGAREVLECATKCGEHLLNQRRIGADGRRSWIGQGMGKIALNGMAHGAAGFAYSMASLAKAAERPDFAKAAVECVELENSSYSPERRNWPDLRDGTQAAWTCQWCHGAVGIGLARIATAKQRILSSEAIRVDVMRALEGAEQSWPNDLDILCCGTLGNIEFLNEASTFLERPDLRDLALRRLGSVIETAAIRGDYRWGAGDKSFNLGMFRGLAGVGYTLLRCIDASLPNVIAWE